MGGRLRILVGLVLTAVALLCAGPALAQGGGTTTSAGDQQYVDPLSTQTSTTPAPSSSPPASSTPAPSSSSGATSSTPTTSGSAPPAAAPSSAGTASTAPSDAPSGTLPFTGLNLGVLVAVGVGLLGAGLVLRRAVRRS